MVTVEEIMSTNVKTLQADDPIIKGMSLMSENNIRHIPIVDKHHQLIGIVSHRDLLRADLSCLADTSSDSRSHIETAPIRSIMSDKVRTATPADSLLSVGIMLQKGKFGCIPIMDDGVLVGIITDTDFVSAAINLIEELENFNEPEDVEIEIDELK